MAAAACAGSLPDGRAVPLALQPTGLACRPSTTPVTWIAPPAARRPLDGWCASVGPPLLDATPRADVASSSSPTTLTLVSWNIHGGVADLEGLLRTRGAHPVPHAATSATVLLLQEVVRRDVRVPSDPARVPIPGALHGPGRGTDIAAIAARLGYAMAYVPSMRNGATRPGEAGEDRGNAILSSLPLEDVTAVELPPGQQRRVAVAATIGVGPVGDRRALRLVSFHLDTRGGRAAQASVLATWLRGETARGARLIAGGDVNALWGTRDAGYRALAEALPVLSCGRGRTNRWPWNLHVLLGWWRGRLDYVFSTLDTREVSSCRTWPDYLGSDHLPVVLTLDLRRTADASTPSYASGRGNRPRASS